jgi:uncharacterized membrane protein YgdD (TMEM256/DUF423 family)
MWNAWIAVAAASGCVAVVAGAFGAHGLKARVAAEQVASWSTAAQYHLLHSVVLLALALFSAQSGRAVGLQSGLLLAGIVLFSGSIYLLVLTPARWLGPVTPVGGLFLIAGWLSLLLLARS